VGWVDEMEMLVVLVMLVVSGLLCEEFDWVSLAMVYFVFEY
jgi:hypothetical protein